MAKEPKCKTCKKAIFIAKFATFKCPHAKFRADSSWDGLMDNCEHYEKGTPQESKDNEAYYKDMDYKEGEE